MVRNKQETVETKHWEVSLYKWNEAACVENQHSSCVIVGRNLKAI